MAFNLNSPFWTFFDNINEEVEQFNRLLASNGFEDRVKVSPSTQAIKSSANSDNKQLAKRSQDSNSLIFPSLFNSPFFNSTNFDVVPPVDILEHDKDYELHISIPGAEKNKINLEFNSDKNEITVNGEIPGHNIEKSSNTLKVNERSSGKFERHIKLPTTTKLDEDNIKATYDKGVLVLKVPRIPNDLSNARRIEITSSESWSSTDSEESIKEDKKSESEVKDDD